MHPRAQVWLLGVRACALGGVAAAFGVFGHVHAGGGAPGAAQVVTLWLAASVVASGFLMREAGWLRIVALLLAEQLLIHLGLMWMVGMPSMPGMPGMRAMAGMDMPAMRPMSVLPSGGMLAGHALAALIAGLWLWRGERALWTLIALAGASLRVLWRRFVITPVALPAVRTATELLPLWGLRVAREVSRRGPPLIAVQ